MFYVDKGPCSMLSTVVSQLLSLAVFFIIVIPPTAPSTTQEGSVLRIDDNRLETGSPDIIRVIVGSVVTKIQGDSKRWTQLKSKRHLDTRQTVGCGIPSSLLPYGLTCVSYAQNSLEFVSRSTLIHVVGRSFAFTQTAYLLKLVIPTTNSLPRWRLNVEMKTKFALHSSCRLSFNELTNAKYLVLHSSHFALN